MSDNSFWFHEAVQEFLENGYSVIPVLEDKRPACKWAEFREKRIKIDEIGRYWNGTEKLGLICGCEFGMVEVVDVDDGEVWDDLIELVENEIGLDGFLLEQSPNGYHIIYKSKYVEGPRKLAMTEDGKVRIETRGRGSYIICAPSNGYNVISGGFGELRELDKEEREKLLEICKGFDEKTTRITPTNHALQAQPVSGGSEASGGSRVAACGEGNVDCSECDNKSEHKDSCGTRNVGDCKCDCDEENEPKERKRIKRWGDWIEELMGVEICSEVLGELGWKMVGVGSDGKGSTYWRRPGKDSGSGSGELFLDGRFQVYTTNDKVFEAGQYGTFAVVGLGKFNGDWEKASEWCYGKLIEGGYKDGVLGNGIWMSVDEVRDVFLDWIGDWDGLEKEIRKAVVYSGLSEKEVWDIIEEIGRCWRDWRNEEKGLGDEDKDGLEEVLENVFADGFFGGGDPNWRKKRKVVRVVGGKFNEMSRKVHIGLVREMERVWNEGGKGLGESGYYKYMGKVGYVEGERLWSEGNHGVGWGGFLPWDADGLKSRIEESFRFVKWVKSAGDGGDWVDCNVVGDVCRLLAKGGGMDEGIAHGKRIPEIVGVVDRPVWVRKRGTVGFSGGYDFDSGLYFRRGFNGQVWEEVREWDWDKCWSELVRVVEDVLFLSDEEIVRRCDRMEREEIFRNMDRNPQSKSGNRALQAQSVSGGSKASGGSRIVAWGEGNVDSSCGSGDTKSEHKESYDGRNAGGNGSGRRFGESQFVGWLMSYVLGQAFDGGRPAWSVIGNLPGTGKSTLIDIFSGIIWGEEGIGGSLDWPRDKNEREKVINGALLAGQGKLLFDNIEAGTEVSDGRIAEMLTSGKVRVRRLGGSDLFDCKVRGMVIFSGNGLTLSEEIARRTNVVMLEAPFRGVERRKVKNPWVVREVVQRSEELYCCVLRLVELAVQIYEEEGLMVEKESGFRGFFDEYVRNSIWVREGVDILAGMGSMSGAMSEESSAERQSLMLLKKIFGNNEFTTGDVFELIQDDGVVDNDEDVKGLRESLLMLNGRADKNLMSLGKAIGKLVNQPISGEDGSKLRKWKSCGVMKMRISRR